MTPLSLLFHTLYEHELLPRERFVHLVESNIQIFDLKKKISDEREYDETLHILADYAIILSQDRHAEKSMPYVDYCLALFENHPKLTTEELLQIKHYETLLFSKAANFYYTGKFNSCRKILKRLKADFPENITYQRWDLFARNRFISKVNLYMLATLTLVFFGSKIFVEIPLPMIWGVVMVFIASVAIECFLFFSNRQLKLTGQKP